MRPLVFVAALVCSAPAFAGAPMNVTICDLAKVGNTIVGEAQAETESVFRSAGIRIAWIPCGEFDLLESTLSGPVFIIRLRRDPTRQPVGSASLDTMGKAYLSSNGRGTLADAYVDPIRINAMIYQANAGALLGCVIAHELGHMLLGPGHESNGVMRMGWRGGEARELNKGWLKFNAKDSARLPFELQKAITAGH